VKKKTQKGIEGITSWGEKEAKTKKEKRATGCRHKIYVNLDPV
jgi:hypothetical protein